MICSRHNNIASCRAANNSSATDHRRRKETAGGSSGGRTAATDDICAVQQKSLPDQRHVTLAADETLVVPMPVLERRKLDRSRACTSAPHMQTYYVAYK